MGVKDMERLRNNFGQRWIEIKTRDDPHHDDYGIEPYYSERRAQLVEVFNPRQMEILLELVCRTGLAPSFFSLFIGREKSGYINQTYRIGLSLGLKRRAQDKRDLAQLIGRHSEQQEDYYNWFSKPEYWVTESDLEPNV